MATVIEHLPQRRTVSSQAGRRVRGGSAAAAPAQATVTLTTLAREELREIVRRLALGERPGIGNEPVRVR